MIARLLCALGVHARIAFTSFGFFPDYPGRVRCCVRCGKFDVLIDGRWLEGERR